MPFSRWTVRAFLSASVLLLSAMAAYAGMRGPWPYSGVILFDRWGACHLYSGVYLMEVSETIKDSLHGFTGQAVIVDSSKVYQPRNPGDGLIEEFRGVSPAPESELIRGLSLRATARFRKPALNEFLIELRNDSAVRRDIETEDLAPTVFSPKRGPTGCWSPADGRSFAAATRVSVEWLIANPITEACFGDPKWTLTLSLVPEPHQSRRISLEPGQSFVATIRLTASPGEYEFLAGYGGGVHQTRPLVSQQIAFDIDRAGHAKLVEFPSRGRGR